MNGRLGLLRWRRLGSKLSSVTSENIIWVRSGGRSCWGHWLRGTRSCREQSYSSFPLSPPELENKVLGTSFSLLILDLIFYASQIPLRVRWVFSALLWEKGTYTVLLAVLRSLLCEFQVMKLRSMVPLSCLFPLYQRCSHVDILDPRAAG